MTLLNRILNILITTIILAGGGYFAWQYFLEQEQEKTTSATPAAPAKPAPKQNPMTLSFPPGAPQLSYLKIEAVEALPEPVLDPLNGRIAYDENVTARVASSIAGRVVRMGADPGDTVTAGQPLLWLSSPEFSAALADVKKAQADLKQKQLAYNRAKTLFEGEVLAKKDLETSENDLNQSEAELQRAESRFANLNPTGEPDDKYILRAPLGGVIADRQVNPGTEVRPDAPNSLFVITDPHHLWVILDLPERDIGKVKPGQPLIVEVDAFPGKRFPGKVVKIGTVLDPGTRRIQVRCAIANPDLRLRPEMFARVTPLADSKNRLVRILNASLLTQGLYSYVFVEQSPGVIEKRRISLSMQGHDDSYVKSGLKEGERVVTHGVLLLNSEFSEEDGAHAK